MIRRYAAVAFWILLATIAFATLSPIGYRPRTGHAFLERSAAYFALGAAFVVAWPRRIILGLMVLAFASGGLEWAQALAPGRHARAVDALVKFAGALTGGATALVVSRWVISFSTRRRRQSSAGARVQASDQS
jgi:VanZ family protein